jgi:crotonobetainyl-CoA:carnitine CoA-transferase CaiB-like acyl-CoA transferase
MARSSSKPADLATIKERREKLQAELAELDAQEKAAEAAARDAGRPVLVAALDKIKIAAMDKAEAKAIATAIGQHGGKAVAEHLASLAVA